MAKNDAPAKVKDAAPKNDAPAKVKLLKPHGFIDEDTCANHHWNQGDIVADADEIALLIERGAALEEVME